MSGRPSKNFRWQQACMWLFLHLQSEGHGGGSLDTQMKHSGGSSVGKVNTSCTGTTRTVISAGGAVLCSAAPATAPPSCTASAMLD